MFKKNIIMTKEIYEEHKKIQKLIDICLRYRMPMIDPITNHYIDVMHFLNINKEYITWSGKASKKLSEQHILGTITKTNYAFISIPPFGSYEEEHTGAYILLHVLAKLHRQNPIGWIFDLRDNTGGIIYSFILGFLSIFDDFMVSCTDKTGAKKMEFGYEDDEVFYRYIGQEKQVFGTLPPITKIDIKNVHVLVNNETASCGELVTYLLKKYKSATIYGEPTYGVPTWMNNIDLPDIPNVATEIYLNYPELLFNFYDTVNYVTQETHYKIQPDITDIPYDIFGMF